MKKFLWIILLAISLSFMSGCHFLLSDLILLSHPHGYHCGY